MVKVAVIFANGTEEVEALTTVDVLRRASAFVDVISVSGKTPVGSHGIKIIADERSDSVDFSKYDAVVIPGGMPGAVNIANDDNVFGFIENLIESGKLVAAICAAPAVVLARGNFIKNRKATCYPALNFIEALGASYTGADVEVDGNLITANGPKAAMKFALAICENLGLNPKF